MMILNSENQVTVIIPWGIGHLTLLGTVLESCMKASPRPDQIIVVEDFPGSKAEEHFVKYPSVKFYCLGEHRGRSYARNFAVAKADTPWLYFLDADDFLEPTAIEDFREIMVNNRLDLLYADYDYIDKTGKRNRVRKKPFKRQRIIEFGYNYVNIGMFVRRDRFLAVGGFDEDMAICEYWDLFLRYVMNPRIRIHKHSRPFFVARQASSVLPNAEIMMERGTRKIQALVRGGYYKQWINK
jgi:glycosyltransferase involved in cell wall biosynthesis